MKEFLETSLEYLFNVFVSTFQQLLIILVPLLLLAIVMHFVSRLNQQLSIKVFGIKTYLYIFGWLGTAVHELGHALFALLFAHKIDEIKLFSINQKNSTLGYVSHSYKKDSIYQNIGNFFIGIGPILLGSLVLFLAIWLLFGINIFEYTESQTEINFHSIPTLSSIHHFLIDYWNSLNIILNRMLLRPSAWWKIIILVYILYSVGSSITLSPEDIIGSARGLLFTMMVLFAFNLFTLWLGDFTLEFFTTVNGFLTGLYFIIILTIVLNIVFIILLFFVGLITKNKSV